MPQPDMTDNWQVLRQDDNGNVFVVQNNLDRETAERLVMEYLAKGHKQLYWAERQPTS